MKKIAILGSTGSIGTQALDIIAQNPDKYSVEILSCKSNVDLLARQIEKFSPKAVVVGDEKKAKELAGKYKNIEILYGDDGLKAASGSADYDMLLNALVGISGLVPTYYAIGAGRDIALANKETLVTGGELIMQKARKKGVNILPVDSEHSAIFQCMHSQGGLQSGLQGELPCGMQCGLSGKQKNLKRILLTASGGPFRGKSYDELKDVTLAEALNHPNWSMGNKITIDSATMMNKGFEIIEAKWLFDVDIDDIKVLVHPQSIVHSGIELIDGSVIMQMGSADMRIPIGLALSYPKRLKNTSKPLDFFKEASRLTFEEPDADTFRCLALACEAGRKGGSYPVVLNAANEILVARFLAGKISFLDIQSTLEEIMEAHVPTYNLTLEKIVEIDRQTRKRLEQ